MLGRKKTINQRNEFYQCDFKKGNIPISAFTNINTVVHCGGLAHDSSSKMYSSTDYKLVNIDFTIKLAKFANQSGVRNFIYLSSVKAAPFKREISNDETSDSEPLDDYGLSKKNSEIALLNMQKNINMSIIIIRPALVYGENVGGNLLKMIESIDKKIFPPIPDISNERSLVHIDYLIDFILGITQYKNLKGEVFILTDNRSYSIKEIYDSIYWNLKNKKMLFSFPGYFFYFASIIGDFINHYVKFPFNSKVYKKIFFDEVYSNSKSRKYFKPEKNYNLIDTMQDIISSYKKNKIGN